MLYRNISGHVFLRLDLGFLVDIHIMDLLIGVVFGQLLKLSVKKYWSSLALNLEVYVDDLIYLLTVIELTTGGSSTVHIYT